MTEREIEDAAILKQQQNECLECGGAGHVIDFVDMQYEKCGICRGTGSLKPKELS